jgi:hypothetical protein
MLTSEQYNYHNNLKRYAKILPVPYTVMPLDSVQNLIIRRPTMTGAKYGAIAGLIATWSISTMIAASEVELGLRISTFYSIMGISLGSFNFVTAAYLGFGLHIITGTILGAIIGAIAVKVESRKNLSRAFRPTRSILMGIGTGVLVWIVLFLPITVLLVQPSLDRIAEILSFRANSTFLTASDSNSVIQSFNAIAISSILFHIVWGAIFGFIISSLVRMKISSHFLAYFHNPTPANPLSLSSTTIKTSYSYSTKRFSKSSPSIVKILTFGLVAGLISSLAVSGLILLAEKVSSIPVGTFYYVLVSSVTDSLSGNTQGVIALGFAMHLAAGSLIGLIMSLPLVLLRKYAGDPANNKPINFVYRYGPLYGIAFGVGLWLFVFLPITFLVVVPLLNSYENQDVLIRQSVPTGEVSSTTFFGLLSMLDKIIYGAMIFNIFYGLCTAIILQSFTQKYLLPHQSLTSTNTN